MASFDKAAVAALFAWLSLSVAACAPETPGETDDEEADSRDDAIKGGSAATGYPEAALIDMYFDGQLGAACSGAVIAPRVVLTAGHCVHGVTSWVVRTPFASSQSAQSSGGATYDWNTDSETVDPNMHDIGLVFLKTDIKLNAYPTLASAKIASGSKVQNIGRINNGSISNTKLFLGPQIAVSDGSKYGYPFDYASTEIIESGDSGGPVVQPGTHNIVAVNSGAGGGLEVLARADLLKTWITQQVAAHPGGSTTPTTPPATNPSNPCGNVTYAGDCLGNTVEWCENNKVNKINCSTSGKQCGFDNANQYYNCL